MRNEEFKEAVGRFLTGITIITTSHGGKLCGFTANSFTSVSLSPMLVSFCLNKESGSFDAFKATKHFSINILAEDQAEISRHFAKSGDNKFSEVNYEISSITGTPLISEAASFIECEKYNEFECGDHFIFIGKAIVTKVDKTKSPLLYFEKSYFSIKPK